MRPVPILLLAQLLAASASATDSHDLALEARRSGAIAPLPDILAAVAAQVPGSVIEVELKRRDVGLVYEVEVLTPDGVVVEVRVDARDKRILDRQSESDEGN